MLVFRLMNDEVIGINIYNGGSGNHNSNKIGEIKRLKKKFFPNAKKVKKETIIAMIKTLKYHNNLVQSKKLIPKYLYLENNYLPKKIEKMVVSKLVLPGYYGDLDKGHDPIEWSIYKMAIRKKTYLTHKKIEKEYPKIISIFKKHKNGHESLKNIVETFDVPPLNVMRKILKEEYKFPKVRIQKVLEKPFVLKKEEHKKLKEAIIWGIENDVVNSTDQSVSQYESKKYEQKFEKMLIEKNINFKVQEELVKEQKEKYGNSIATPDILFLDKVYINNKPVSWVDLKNYYYMNIPFITKSLEKQAKRNVEKWGHGAFIFSSGFAEDAKKINGTMFCVF